MSENPNPKMSADEFSQHGMNSESKSKERSAADASRILTEVVEIQNRIQASELEIAVAATLIAERTQKLTQADIAAVGIVDGEDILYYSAKSLRSQTMDYRVALPASASSECIAKGEVLQYSALAAGISASPKLSASGMKAFLAIPVRHQSRIIGVLELRFQSENSLRQQDVQVGHLMAGLVSDAFSRAAEVESKRMLTLERATMLQALAQLKPQLELLATAPSENLSIAQQEVTSATTKMPMPSSALDLTPIRLKAENSAFAKTGAPLPDQPTASASESWLLDSKCRRCDEAISPEEFFCGNCGTARMEIAGENSRDTQVRWASLWYRQQASEQAASKSKPTSFSPGDSSIATTDDSSDTSQPSRNDRGELPVALQEFAKRFAAEDYMEGPPETSVVTAPEAPSSTRAAIETFYTPEGNKHLLAAENEPEKPPAPPWTSATNTRQWLESIQPFASRKKWLAQRWQEGRANFYLGLSFILLVIAVSGWGTHRAGSSSPAHQNSAKYTQGGPSGKPQLGFFEKSLINLGLAEAPVFPVYHGNPNAKVWVDLHSAQYYCEDADLYGKSAPGKFTTQVDAQRDHFEPAYRSPCD